MSAREQAEITLREAFPSIDAGVVRAVLTASRGEVEPAFNALLGMSDPDSQREAEPTPPAKPPRPAQQPTSTKLSQMEADELYARQLAEQYNASPQRQQPQRRDPTSRFNEDLPGSRVGKPGANPNPDDVPWRSFVDGMAPGLRSGKYTLMDAVTDDLPEIRDNIRKGFVETQKTVNSWISAFKKKIDGDDEQEFEQTPPLPARPTQQSPFAGRRSGELRRSTDMQRYDADMQPIGDDFSKLDLREGDAPPRTSSRPLANPNLFKSGQDRRPSPATNRKVSFQDGPPEEIKDMYSSASPAVTPAAKSSKWQPLQSIDPSPVGDNDPFSLGDSDEERDAKVITLKDDEDDVKDVGKKATVEDEQAKKPAEETMKENIATDAK